MRSPQEQYETIFIVDSRPDDYQQLLQQTCRRESVAFFSSAEEALRTTSTARGLWMINSRLPDMSGIEFCELLKPRLGGSTVVLVADRYNADDELAALCAGSLHFAAKPLSSDWLAQLVPTWSRPALPQMPAGVTSVSGHSTAVHPPSIR